MNEVTVFDKIENPLEAIEVLGKKFAASGMFGIDDPKQGEMMALSCLVEKKDPFEIDAIYDFIGGKRRKKSEAMLASFYELGGTVKWHNTGKDGKEASATFSWRGDDQTESYTIEMAKTAGLVKPGSGWVKRPANMLRARLISNTLRFFCPQATNGAYTPEEGEDIAEEKREEKAAKRRASGAKPLLKKLDPSQKIEPFPDPVEKEADATVIDPRIDELSKVFEGIEGDVTNFMVDRGWIKDGQRWSDLNEKRLSQVYSNQAKFVSAVGKFVDKEA
jgi:hypothetical protein